MLATSPVSPRQYPARDRFIVAIVGYRNATEIRACLAALARSTEQNFSISICENGGKEAYVALVAALSGLVEKVEVATRIVDRRVVTVWTGHLSSNNQLVRIYLANANLGYAGGINVCIRQLEIGRAMVGDLGAESGHRAASGSFGRFGQPCA